MDERDRPERDIKIKQIQVFVDPFEEYQTRLKNKLAHEANRDAEDEEARRKREKEDKMGWFGPSISKQVGSETSAGVGKYLQTATSSSEGSKKRNAEHVDQSPAAEEEIGVSQKKFKALQQQSQQKKSSYGNFDNF